MKWTLWCPRVAWKPAPPFLKVRKCCLQITSRRIWTDLADWVRRGVPRAPQGVPERPRACPKRPRASRERLGAPWGSASPRASPERPRAFPERPWAPQNVPRASQCVPELPQNVPERPRAHAKRPRASPRASQGVSEPPQMFCPRIFGFGIARAKSQKWVLEVLFWQFWTAKRENQNFEDWFFCLGLSSMVQNTVTTVQNAVTVVEKLASKFGIKFSSFWGARCWGRNSSSPSAFRWAMYILGDERKGVNS